MPNPATSASSPLIIDELVAGTPYRVQIQHRNAHGWGPLSEKTEPITPEDLGMAALVRSHRPLIYYGLGEATGTQATDESGVA